MKQIALCHDAGRFVCLDSSGSSVFQGFHVDAHMGLVAKTLLQKAFDARSTVVCQVQGCIAIHSHMYFNGEMVAKVVEMAKLFGREVATPDEAREILSIPPRKK